MDEHAAALELLACTPAPVEPEGFNPKGVLPYGCTSEHIQQAMSEFIAFLGSINQQFATKGIQRFESMLMPANFSLVMSEFMHANLPKYCPDIARNQSHDGHPALVPSDLFPNNSVQQAEEGIEIICSRYPGGWQSPHPEKAWLMVFVFDSNRSVDASKSSEPKPFRFTKVVAAHLSQEDWKQSGRKTGNRRAAAASLLPSGYEKMLPNWIYMAPGYDQLADQGTEE